jgi:6-phosphogluconolactonase
MKSDIRIFKDLENLSRHAAELFVERAAQAIKERGHFLVALNGGGTPTRLFQLLASNYRDEVEWSRVHVFWGDERCVPPDDPGSSYGQAKEILLHYVAVPESNIHRVKGELDPASSSTEYAQILKSFAKADLEFPRFDLVYLGMGEDGHTASLFPGSMVDVTEAVIPVTAKYQDRPANRVTMTQVVFNQARRVVFMATGEKKASTLAEVLSDRYNPDLYPAQRIDPKDGELIWLVDEGAAGRLPRGLNAFGGFCEG